MTSRGAAALIGAGMVCIIEIAALLWGRTGAWLWVPAVVATVLVVVAIVDMFLGGQVDDEDADA